MTLLNVIKTRPFGYSVDMASDFVVATIAQCAPVCFEIFAFITSCGRELH